MTNLTMVDSRCGCSLKLFYFVHHLPFGIVVFEGVKEELVSNFSDEINYRLR